MPGGFFYELAGDLPQQARAFVLNIDDEETTGIKTISLEGNDAEAFPREGLDGVWYTLDGRRLSAMPTQKGIYINNGRKAVIK
jgi:hypothetical protein